MGVTLNTSGLDHWLAATVVMVIGMGLFEMVRRRFAREWEEIQAFIEMKTNQGDAQ